jgi:hypothetical protein
MWSTTSEVTIQIIYEKKPSIEKSLGKDILHKEVLPSPTSMTSIYSLILKNWVSFVGPPNANTTSHFQVVHHTCINTWKAFLALSRFEQNEQ